MSYWQVTVVGSRLCVHVMGVNTYQIKSKTILLCTQKLTIELANLVCRT